MLDHDQVTPNGLHCVPAENDGLKAKVEGGSEKRIRARDNPKEHLYTPLDPQTSWPSSKIDERYGK